MKHILSFGRGLLVVGIGLAMVTALAAQTATQGTAKVVRIKGPEGSVRFSTGNNVWQPLKVGMVLKPGTVVQTAKANCLVDLALGEGEAPPVLPAVSAAASPGLSYQPTSDQNIVRIWEDSVVAIDKLTSLQTGADVVTETALDLQRGRIMGNVKKMSAASKYEVKIPNGVAGIRGTIYFISAEGVVGVLVGSAVIAYVDSSNNAQTQVVMGGYQFDIRTGQLTPIAQSQQTLMLEFAKESRLGAGLPPTVFAKDHTIYFVSPTTGQLPSASAAASVKSGGGGK